MLPFTLPAGELVNLSVHDVLERRVRTLVEDHQRAGNHQVFWDGRSDQGSPVASGVYLLRLDAEKQHVVRKVTLVK